jgi:hypothetical protein
MSPEALSRMVERRHGCRATHRGSVLVEESFEEPIVWRGYVDVFDLIGHVESRRCYAWSYRTENGRTRCHAVLELPPVDSPVAAVRAVVLAESRRQEARGPR